MATKVTDLTEITTVGDADLVMVVDDSDGASKKIRRDNLLGPSIGGYLAGKELWRWNKTDLTQFDSVIYHGNSTGAKSGSVALTVVDAGLAIGNVLRMTGTTLIGGAAYALASGEITLPDRYVVCMTFSTVTITGLVCSSFPHCNLTSLDGVAVSAGRGGDVSLVRALVGDTLNGSEAIVDATAMASLHTDRRGGMRVLTTVRKRQDGETPAASYLINEIRNGTGRMVYDGADVTAISTVGINWDGQTHAQVAFGCFSEASTSHIADIADIKIYAHPDD